MVRNTGAGLVTTYSRIGSGAAKGFLEHTRWKDGDSGTEYLQGTLAYDTSNYLNFGTGPEVSVIRPFVSERGEYHTKTTLTSGSTDWTYSTTVHSGTLATKEVTTTEPAVSTSKNGSGTANTTKVYYNADGTLAFTKDQDAIIGYREYTDGQLTKRILDADTAHADFTGITIPTGFASSGTEIHQVTTYSYDTQGRLDITTTPDLRKLKNYYSRLSDYRLVGLAYADYTSGTPDTFYGPVSYTVQQQAGSPSATGIIELSGNSSRLDS